ncbi:MAG: serine/threonine protein kinase [Deltaproteobacteria bacterium]|nr:MAG: serine/threonine protein kinase [Deltaproteobacteria bacterium]
MKPAGEGARRATPRPRTELRDSNSTARSTTGGRPNAQHILARQELAHDVRGLRAIWFPTLILWPLTGVLDWYVCTFDRAGPLSHFLVIRAGALVVASACLARLWRPPLPSRRLLSLLDIGMFGTASLAVSLMALRYDGIASPYATGIILVVLARGALLAMPWRYALLGALVSATTFPAVMGGAALADVAGVRSQFADRALAARFGEHLVFLGLTVGLVTWGSHAIWRVRRAAFEARSIGRYRLERRIGAGGMGEVWAAYHKGIRRNVAVKLLRADRVTSDVDVARFEREVDALASLSHPNTVRVFDYGVTDDGIWYYAMELLDGVTLASLVRREGPLPPARAVHLLEQAARAFSEAHGRGIVHRDIKPENLFVARVGGECDVVKVLDFGIAKLLHVDAGATLTHGDWVGGTPAFISPEAARGRPVDARSDVYGLGAVLYFALTGRAPFPDTNVAALLDAHAHRTPEPPSRALGRALPPDVEAVAMRCLEKDPDRRYRDASELAAALSRCRELHPWRPVATAPPPAPASSVDAALAATVDFAGTPPDA